MAEKWIQKAIKKPGALRSALGVKEGKTIPAKKLAKAAKAPGKLGQRARLAQTLKKMKLGRLCLAAVTVVLDNQVAIRLAAITAGLGNQIHLAKRLRCRAKAA